MEIKGYDEWLTDDKEKFVCEKCERKVPYIDDLTEVSGGILVCEECLHDYFECDICFEFHLIDDVSEVDEVCIDCFNDRFAKCPICDKNFDVEKSKHYDEESNRLCDVCFNELKHL